MRTVSESVTVANLPNSPKMEPEMSPETRFFKIPRRSLDALSIVWQWSSTTAGSVRSSESALSSGGRMRCSKCGCQEDKVIDSRTSREGATIRRRRECIGCGNRFTTYEEIERDGRMVIK